MSSSTEPTAATSSTLTPASPPRLLDQIRAAARDYGHPENAAASFAEWVRAYVLFHGKRHPRDLGLAEIGRFLEHVVRREQEPLANKRGRRQFLSQLFGR